jgi:hypothetical protein
MGVFLCILSFLGCFYLGRRSLGTGLAAVIAVGYFYGILRAQFLDGFTHLLFDFAALGLYASQFVLMRRDPARRLRSREVKLWVVALIGWPLILFLLPVNNFLIQLVGLRAAIYFVPFVLLGARAVERDLDQLARTIAGLNLVAFGFAVAESVVGVQPFFPINAVTEIIYASSDVGDGQLRIPATFTSAHAYAGTMVATLPFLIARWQASGISRVEKMFFSAAIVASSLGIFMAAVRLPVVILFIELAVLVLARRLPLRVFVSLAVLGSVIGYIVADNERLQRFTTLGDSELVTSRVSSSVNASLVDLLVDYPLGGGLGSAAGTSVPYFLQDLVGTQIGLENEYARIAMELSPIGLVIWLAFIVWALARRPPQLSRDWLLGASIMRAFVLVSWATAFIGTGMLASVPTTALLLLQMGILGRSRLPPMRPAAPRALMRT